MDLIPETNRWQRASHLPSVAGLLLLFQAGSSAAIASNPFDNWHLRNPLPVTLPLSSVAYGNGLFLATGFNNSVATSPDGLHWTGHAFPATNGISLSGLAFGNGRFVAVDGWTNIWTTADGLSWTQRGVDLGQDSYSGMVGIAYANGLFVAVGGSGLIVTSPDADQWTVQRVGQAADLSDVTYGQGTFVAVGGSNLPGDSIFTSPDGNNWTAQDSGNGLYLYLGAVAYGNGQFVAIDNRTKAAQRPSGPLWVLTSPDGATWTRQELQDFNNCSVWDSLAFANGQFVAGGSFTSPDCSTKVGNLLTSTDGTNWRSQLVGDRNTDLMNMTYDYGQYVAVGETFWQSGSYFSAAVFSSADGTAWTRRDSGIHETLDSVAYGNGQFVAVGSFYTTNGTILTSSDGSQWTKQDSGTTNQLMKIAYGNGRFVIMGEDIRHNPRTPLILTSTNGVRWTMGDPETTNLLTALAYGNGLFTAIGGNDTVVTSVDGTRWQALSSPTNGFKSCTAIAVGNGIFVAVGNRSWNGTAYVDQIFTSTDGVHWTQRTSGLDISPRTVAFGNEIFVALPVTGSQVLTSRDGTQWTLQTVAFDTGDTSTDRFALGFGNGHFIAAGGSLSSVPTLSLFYTSSDGVNWEAHNSEVSQLIFGIAFGAGTCVAVGDHGVIVQSDPLGGSGNPPSLGIPRWLGADGVQFTIAGDLGVNLQIQTSLDLAHWNSLTNLTLQASPTPWQDSSAVDARRKFYRAVTP